MGIGRKRIRQGRIRHGWPEKGKAARGKAQKRAPGCVRTKYKNSAYCIARPCQGSGGAARRPLWRRLLLEVLGAADVQHMPIVAARSRTAGNFLAAQHVPA